MRDIKVIYSNITPLLNRELFDKYYDLVSEYRRGKVDKLTVPADKARSLGAGYISEHFSGDYMYSNISHSGDYSMVVFWDDMVGCDIERLGRVTGKVANRFFCKSEAMWCDTKEKATQMWTYKESFAKAVEKGLGLSFKEFEIVPFDSYSGAEVIHHVTEGEFGLVAVDTDPDYRASVCYKKSDFIPEIIVKSYCLT